MSTQIHVDLTHTFPRTFVPKDADMGDWPQIEPLFADLLNRKPSSVEDLERWLQDYSELSSALSEESSKRYVVMTSQTDDPAREAAYQEFEEKISPKIKPLADAVERAYLANPMRKQLSAERYAIWNRKLENRVALFREKNVPLETEEALLAKDYYKIDGAMTVNVNGNDLTIVQAQKLLEETDRSLRQRVWEQIASRRLQDKDRLEALFDRLVALRGEIAANAGYPNFRDYTFRRRERFDYTPDDCFRFHDAVERAVMPLVEKILTQRKNLMKVETLRPWDRAVDPLSRAPLKPFSATSEFVEGTRRVFSQVSPDFGQQFQFMADHGLLDLESRKGKAPGGYQAMFDERRLPFIFMNAVGRDLDLRILMHEGGHSFHSLACRQEPLFDYRAGIPYEFAEVASMGMEMLVLPHLDEFYSNTQDLQRALRSRIEDVVMGFTGIMIGDAFQHWIYTHPAHTREERSRKWVELFTRFTRVIDWTGYEEQRAYFWHPILHFFAMPFYFIDYAIAQIGALQVWLRSRKNYPEAVERYWSALTLGGSRTLPELFEAAGAHFRFDYETLAPLMEALDDELERLEK